MPHVVKFIESERGWGGEVWYNTYDTEGLARADVAGCNKKNLPGPAPDYYIQAEYMGNLLVVPKGYRH